MKNTPALIDIGVNLADSRFNDDLVDVLERAQQAGVDTLVMTGTDEEVSRTVSKLAHQYDKQFPAMLYATVGIHPHYADQFNSNSLTTLSQLATSPKVVAIGETGLDFNRNFSAPKNQIHAFEQQLQLACELNKPVFMHERDAAKRQLEILRAHRDYLTKGVIHCFTGDRATLFAYLDLDLYIGITGWICDERRGLPLQQLVASIPLDRLMIESDAPYLLPRTIQPQPSNRRNEPCYLPWVLKGIAKFRDEPIRTLAAATRKTTQAFFNL
jgi:TatD DNase family protein